MPSSRFCSRFETVVAWLRAGYPDEAPRTGHSPLLALNGPRGLTPTERKSVFDELTGRAVDTNDIEVAITKATDRLPTRAQVRTIAKRLPVHALHH